MYTLVHVHCSFVLVVSFVATAKFASQPTEIGILRGSDLILPTKLDFESSGFCDLQPVVNAARLQYSPINSTNRETYVLCEPMCNNTLQELRRITYNFEDYGDITIPNASEGLYMMGMQRPCPSPSAVITATYMVTYISPGKLCVQSAYIYYNIYCSGWCKQNSTVLEWYRLNCGIVQY